jgi:hypothetical protein
MVRAERQAGVATLPGDLCQPRVRRQPVIDEAATPIGVVVEEVGQTFLLRAQLFVDRGHPVALSSGPRGQFPVIGLGPPRERIAQVKGLLPRVQLHHAAPARRLHDQG